jgi:hypothetical protein
VLYLYNGLHLFIYFTGLEMFAKRFAVVILLGALGLISRLDERLQKQHRQ